MSRAPAARADLPLTVGVPRGAPVLADRGYDSDPRREPLEPVEVERLARHRADRTAPPTTGG